MEGMIKQGEAFGIKNDPEPNEDIHALKWTLIFGIKGVAAYADHARILGQEDDAVYAFIHEGMAATLKTGLSVDDCVAAALKCGEINLRAMELLDAGNTGTYGHPVPHQRAPGRKGGERPFWYPVMT